MANGWGQWNPYRNGGAKTSGGPFVYCLRVTPHPPSIFLCDSNVVSIVGSHIGFEYAFDYGGSLNRSSKAGSNVEVS